MLIRFATTTFAVSLVAALATGCTVTTNDDDDGGGTATLTIVNDETFEIDNIYISPSGFETDDDILNGVPLDNTPPDNTITAQVTCDNYDIEIVDPVSDCYISEYSLCGTDDEWDITDSFFDGCSSSEPRTPTTAAHSPSPVLQVRR
ncbi:MAG TPA: hypothetical protein VGG74_04565 [Kofleriaceae bacterium]|jgi:hypothetical protein